MDENIQARTQEQTAEIPGKGVNPMQYDAAASKPDMGKYATEFAAAINFVANGTNYEDLSKVDAALGAATAMMVSREHGSVVGSQTLKYVAETVRAGKSFNAKDAYQNIVSNLPENVNSKNLSGLQNLLDTSQVIINNLNNQADTMDAADLDSNLITVLQTYFSVAAAYDQKSVSAAVPGVSHFSLGKKYNASPNEVANYGVQESTLNARLNTN